jgi:hypothetical protein
MPDAQPAPVGGPLPRGHLLALNRSFRRTLEAENKSPRTVEAYTDAVRFLALYCEAHGKSLLARQLRREHIQDFIADQLARWKPATAHNRYRGLHAFFKWAVAAGDLQASPMDGMKPPNLPESPSVSSGQSSSSASSRPVRAGTSPAGVTPPSSRCWLIPACAVPSASA